VTKSAARLFAALNALVLSAQCPQTATLENSPYTEYWLTGTAGHNPIRMYIARGGPAVVGLFYQTADWTPRLLGGQWKGITNIELSVTAEQGQSLGHITATLKDGRFTGAWMQPSKSPTPINLNRAPRPACAEIGPVRTFSNAAWPVTFSYPAAWRIRIGETVTLTCPDPAAIAYGLDEIQISKLPDLRQDSILQCGNNWEYGDSCQECQNTPPGLTCDPFKVSTHHGLTILNAGHREFRTYCLGGSYAGQASGASRYVRINGLWINIAGPNPTIVELITNSLAASPR